MLRWLIGDWRRELPIDHLTGEASPIANWAEMVDVELRDLRHAGGVMLAAAAILPRLTNHAGAPCPLRTLTGVPCPLCGMTTSVEGTLRGHVGAALAANPAGVVPHGFVRWCRGE